ncbi:hypothetical protein JTB14_004638 [Gonioctena quinquepunctata]|nr:hypothetical protein JTB14_004638 [Gonioctena quinquepunctata]
MEFLKQPASMGMCGNLGSNWWKFKKYFSLYSIATGCEEKAREVQAAVLLHCLGEEANEVLETLNDRTDPDKIIKQLDVHFLPKSNPNVETHKFNSRNQLYGESVEKFLAELKRIARDCEFGTFKDRLIKEMCGAKVFSTLDANKGFWKIVLTEEASELTTFATHFGRFMFLRLPMVYVMLRKFFTEHSQKFLEASRESKYILTIL